ncbi:MAG: glutamate racemase ['Candidatus Kapabacteria' thiocyanatum]|uniref:Glutamate racemase n=1 Tax=Candidatus Kapaibacterium thiocyanatum TaxID=1895771 RepID=A0A1M3KXX5_9BACT|nr:glutamate racemase ['Candidatus Kapabacteria' thiocyanatum]OJX57272.1 MAG: glutamate racemase ['Candidatus Kapabacteria' thiocyanatum]
MLNDQRPIGVFDSGIGGLSVLKHLFRILPNERFVYLGDTARVPYGNKSTETIRNYSRQCSAFLMQHDVKMIVVACNTASALALDILQAEMPVPVLGVIEPAAMEAVTRTHNGQIGVIGTRATIASNSYARSIDRSAGPRSITVHSQPCPLFVPLVEEGWLDTQATRLVAAEYLRPLIANHIDTLVLGCTHYPLLGPMLASMLPGVALIDCGECTALTAADMLGERQEATGRAPDVLFYLTDHTPSFPVLARQFLGLTSVNEAVRVSIDHLAGPHGVALGA